MISFHFAIKRKSGKFNHRADALSRRYLLLFQLNSYVLGFEHLKSFHKHDMDLVGYMRLVKTIQREIFGFKRVIYSNG